MERQRYARGQIHPLSPLVFAIALFPCASCSVHDGDSSRHASNDTAVPSIMLPPLDSIQTSVWTSRLVYSTLGMDDVQIGDGESLFARFLPDRSLVLATGPQLLVLKADGTFGTTLARDGEGPGEFRVISAFGIGPAGTLFASDHLSARFAELSQAGDMRRYIPRLRPISEDLDTHPFAMLSDGRILAAPSQSRPARKPPRDATGGRIVRDAVPIARYDTAGEITDTLLLLPGLERSNGFVAPFSQIALYAGRGRTWVAGVSDSLDLKVFNETEPVGHLLARRIGQPVSSDMRLRRNSLVQEEWGAETGAAIASRQEEMPVTGILPDVGGVVVDDRGALWVGAYVTPGTAERRWYVFDTNGRSLGRLDLPSLIRPLVPTRTELLDVAYGRVAIVRTSDDGELYLEVRDVIRE